MTSNATWAAAVILTAGLAAASPANATWTFTGTGGVAASATNNNIGITTVSGYEATGGGTGANWTSNSLLFYSGGGLAMNSDGATSPNHAIDNNGNTEAVLLGFSSSVVLSNISLGYATNGASGCPNSCVQTAVDASVFRYTGTLATPTLGSIGSMDGWELVGNYGDLTKGGGNSVNVSGSGATTNTTGGSGGKGSSWWLISAYNSNFGSASQSRGSLDSGNDYFKILAVSGTKCTSTQPGVCGGGTQVNQTPEPASIGLIGVSLLGLAGSRRRHRQV